MQQWLRQPAAKAKGNKDIIFTKQDEDKAIAMITNRRNQHSTCDPPTQAPVQIGAGGSSAGNGAASALASNEDEGASVISSGSGSESATAPSTHNEQQPWSAPGPPA